MRKKTTNNIELQEKDGCLLVNISGSVKDFNSEILLLEMRKKLQNKPQKVQFAVQDLQEWDSSLLVVLYKAIYLAKKQQIAYDISALPQNLKDLINLAFAVDRNPTHGSNKNMSFLGKIGKNTIVCLHKIDEVIAFLGEIFAALFRFCTARSIMRGRDFFDALAECGPKALGIVSLISFLVGLILAFVGAVQLQTFGAQIYVASLVTIGMCRIMGAIMVGIIMAGRTGSAYAATIGTMQVNEELDALKTMGMSALDFLVMPRLLALLIAMPILTMLADFLGMLGGAFVGVFMMGLPYQEYYKYALNAFNLNNFLVGVFHGFCFGLIIALCGCYSGLKCGRDADSVGIATTQSVVYAVVWMIVVTGIITVLCMEFGI